MTVVGWAARGRSARRARRRAARRPRRRHRHARRRAPPGSRCSRAAPRRRRGDRGRPRRRADRALPAPGPAARRGPRARRGGRARDDRPVRRARLGRAAAWPRRAACGWRSTRRRCRWRPASAEVARALGARPGRAGRDRRRGLRAVRVRRARPTGAAAEAAAGLTWIGEVVGRASPAWTGAAPRRGGRLARLRALSARRSAGRRSDRDAGRPCPGSTGASPV